jgi:hypothetical protein
MSETDIIEPVPSKWWVHSVTIWGALITTLSTVAPVIGPLLGLDLTADLVHQFGEQLVEVVQAIAGLIGIIMTIYGRARATTRLERRVVKVQL